MRSHPWNQICSWKKIDERVFILTKWINISWLVVLTYGAVHKLRNAVLTLFWPPTYSNVLAITLSMIYHNRLCISNAFADHPSTPTSLHNLWTTPTSKTVSSKTRWKLVFNAFFSLNWHVKIPFYKSKLIHIPRMRLFMEVVYCISMPI